MPAASMSPDNTSSSPTMIIAHRTKQYGMDLAEALVSNNYDEANKAHRRLALSMMLAASQPHIESVCEFWPPAPLNTAPSADLVASGVVHKGLFDFLNEPYGAKTRKEFSKKIKSLERLMYPVYVYPQPHIRIRRTVV